MDTFLYIHSKLLKFVQYVLKNLYIYRRIKGNSTYGTTFKAHFC